MRLNKFLSHYTKYSRREADTLIKDGRIKIDGKVVVDFIDIQKQEVKLDGKIVRIDDSYSVIIYNKQKGELTTKKDDRERKTIYHSISKRFKHYITIGRLDFQSEGVLLLTDSPKIATKLMQKGIDRVYNLKLDGQITDVMKQAMQEGVLLDTNAGAHHLSKIESIDGGAFLSYEILKNTRNYSRIRVGLESGKNRELRRFFAHFEREVLDLKRISYGPFALNNLPSGKTRFLTSKEYDTLRKMISS
jgi:23S rRNA pseudouridine2605 synthase